MENTQEKNVDESINVIDEAIKNFHSKSSTIHAYDLMETLQEIREMDEEKFFVTLQKFPDELLADVVAEFSTQIQETIADYFGSEKLAEIASEMDTDDAADFIQIVKEKDQDRAERILEKIDPVERGDIRSLISYDDDVAGAYMQKELFSADMEEIVGRSIDHLRQMKIDGEVESINHIHLTEDNGKYVCSLSFEELIFLNPSKTYNQLRNKEDKKASQITANHYEDIKDVIEKVTHYNLSVIPVLDEEGKLTGRITSDDIYDIISDQATDEIYSMAGLNAEAESSEKLKEAALNRGLWLGLNLITAVAASFVISYFDSTIQSFVALAILMPIVASMGGNAGTQSLTVTVRQLSTGEIGKEDAVNTIKREVILSAINGLIFAVIIGVLAHLWFDLHNLGIVIALSTIINLLIAGLFGAIIPMLLEKFDIDPAVGSTVLLTTLTDIVGFFCFLGLAQTMM